MTGVVLAIDKPTLTFLLVALVFLVLGAATALVGVVRGRRPQPGRLVDAVVVLRPDGYGADFPDRRPDFEWTDERGFRHLAHSASTMVPGLWVGEEVVVRLDPEDETRATVVTSAPPRRELLLIGIACILVGVFLGVVGLNEWLH